MIDVEDVGKLISTVAFYGAPTAPLWFIGLEESDEASRESLDELLRRHGLLDTENSVSLRDAVGWESYFPVDPNQPGKLQKTWYGYSKLRFAIHGLPFSKPDLLRYQAHGLGDKQMRDTCLLEFFPLPQKNRGETWAYKSLCAAGFLEDRKSYVRYVVPKRVSLIRQQIEQYQPAVVVLFGSDCRSYFGNGMKLEKIQIMDGLNKRAIYTAQEGRTLLLFVAHPAARGLSDCYWQAIGDYVRAERDVSE